MRGGAALWRTARFTAIIDGGRPFHLVATWLKQAPAGFRTMASSPNIEKAVLPNGLVVISERMEHVRSVSAGIWVCTGSRRESPELNGIAHFIEHMVFKGTARRTAAQIAREVDSVGGMLDAFTSKELICFNAKVLDEHLPIAFDVLSDLVLRPRFEEEDITREKSVILEEIKMEQDNPDFLVHEIFAQNFWRGHPMGQSILGTRQSVKSFTREKIRQCWQQWFAPGNLIITAAGNVHHEPFLKLVREEFGSLQGVPDGWHDSAPTAHASIVTRSKKELEQAHICIGVPAYPMTHERRYGVAVLNNILGGGMSSRLFQKIREDMGLAYAVFSEVSPYRDAGVLTVYAGTAVETAGQVVQLIADEFRHLKNQLVTDEELRRAKDNLKGSLMLSLESTSARMSHLARQEMYFGHFLTLDELLAAIEMVSADEIREIASDFFRGEHIAAAVLGNLDGFRLTREHFAC
jgi:predicted Zn-dependent peptidase